jgi:preprotein translocase subunit YajC
VGAAAEGTKAANPTLSTIMSIAPFAVLLVVFYFFIIRPQNKKQKATQNMLKTLKKGDKIVTIGGVHGTIASVKETTVVVKVDDNCKMEFLRSAIATVVSREDESKETPAPDATDKSASASDKK